ncbi:hypothetical protein D3C75_1092810 [compost metagenome]
MIVAFKQGSDRTQMLHGALVERPDRITHRVIMCIDHIVAIVRVPGQMYLANAFGRQATDKRPRIKTVIARTDIDIVDIQQQLATRAQAQLREKLPLAECVVGSLNVA